MKHLKKFENFYINPLPDGEADEQDHIDAISNLRGHERAAKQRLKETKPNDDLDCENPPCEVEGEENMEEVSNRRRTWGDEIDESKKSDGGLTAKQKKLPLGLQKAILARKSKGAKGSKSEKSEKKDQEKDIDNSGLTAKQKKLPLGLQKAILARKKKKTNESVSTCNIESCNDVLNNIEDATNITRYDGSQTRHLNGFRFRLGECEISIQVRGNLYIDEVEVDCDRNTHMDIFDAIEKKYLQANRIPSVDWAK